MQGVLEKNIGNVHTQKEQKMRHWKNNITKNETVVLRIINIFLNTLKCSNDSIRLSWNWQLCEKI